jgi:mono/diheme cytochrome c family protein
MNTQQTKRWRLAAIAPVAVVIATGSVANAQAPGDGARGKVLAERACAGCHQIEGTSQGTVAAPSLSDIARRPYNTPERLQAFIMTPHRPMPGLPLEVSEVRDIVTYVHSLK